MKSKSIIVLLLLCVSLGGSCQKQEQVINEDTLSGAIFQENIDLLEKCFESGIGTRDEALIKATLSEKETVVRYLY
jgi:hypothetical protein